MNIKPKEFWIRRDYADTKHDFIRCEICTRKPQPEIHDESDFKDALHVVEYSAYQKALHEAKKGDLALQLLSQISELESHLFVGELPTMAKEILEMK